MSGEQNEVHRHLDKELTRSCRADKRQSRGNKTAADKNNPQILYGIVRQLTGSTDGSIYGVSIKSKDDIVT